MANYLGVSADDLQLNSLSTKNLIINGQPKISLFGSVTSNSIVNGAVLTASQLTGAGQVNLNRTGSTSAYSDTTDSAANIISALAIVLKVNPPIGFSYLITIINTVAFAETLLGGVGVTISGLNVIAASSTRTFLVQVTSLTTVTFTSINSATL